MVRATKMHLHFQNNLGSCQDPKKNVTNDCENRLNNKNWIVNWNQNIKIKGSKTRKKITMKMKIINSNKTDQWRNIHWEKINNKNLLNVVNDEHNYVIMFENTYQSLKFEVCMMKMKKCNDNINFLEQWASVCWNGDRWRPCGWMILCGDTTARNGERGGACTGNPPRRKSGGRKRREEQVNNNSYVKISDGS